MKLQRLVLNLTLMSVLGYFSLYGQSEREKLVGEWKGKDVTGETGIIILRQNGFAVMNLGGMEIGDSSAFGQLRWVLDTRTDPLHLDFLITDFMGGSDTMPMIVRMLNDTTIRLQTGTDTEPRPVRFSETDSTSQIILFRQPEEPMRRL